jgi:hypothetical protein
VWDGLLLCGGIVAVLFLGGWRSILVLLGIRELQQARRAAENARARAEAEAAARAATERAKAQFEEWAALSPADKLQRLKDIMANRRRDDRSA